jgi:hypothetical protein
MEHRLWAYSNGNGWFAIDPEACDFDEDRVDTVEAVLEADTKHNLMQKAAEKGFEIAMWLEE